MRLTGGVTPPPDQIEWTYRLLPVALLVWLLLIPPVIGLADNGDFPKVAGRFSLGPAEQGVRRGFDYVVTDLAVRPEYHWDSELISSELLLVGAATQASRWLRGQERFDLRLLAAVHVLLFAAAFWILLALLRPCSRRLRVAVPAMLLVVFCDVAYTAYWNSMFMDAAALSFLLLAVVSMVRARTGDEIPWSLPLLFALSATLLVMAKAAHAPLALPVALFAVAMGGSARGRLRVAWWLVVLPLGLGALIVVRGVPDWYRGVGVFNAVFERLLPGSPDAVAELAELGLSPDYARHIGMDAFEAGPVVDVPFATALARRVGYGRIVRFYLAHPDRAWRAIRGVLRDDVWRMRPPELGNYRKEDGFPPRSHTRAWSVWSAGRGALLRRMPALLPLLYGMVLGWLVWRWRTSQFAARGLALMATLWGMGVCEFAMPTLADSVETYRQLVVFHAITDAMICVLVAELLQVFRPTVRPPVGLPHFAGTLTSAGSPGPPPAATG